MIPSLLFLSNYCSQWLPNTLILLIYNRTTSFWKFFRNLNKYFPFNCCSSYHGWALRLWLCVYLFECFVWNIMIFVNNLIWLLIIPKASLNTCPISCKLLLVNSTVYPSIIFLIKSPQRARNTYLCISCQGILMMNSSVHQYLFTPYKSNFIDKFNCLLAPL